MTLLRWQDAGATEHGLALLRCSHEASWFTVDGLCGLSKFIQGATAGSAIADIVFIFVGVVTVGVVFVCVVTVGVVTVGVVTIGVVFVGVVTVGAVFVGGAVVIVGIVRIISS